jgi:hypothetical protein
VPPSIPSTTCGGPRWCRRARGGPCGATASSRWTSRHFSSAAPPSPPAPGLQLPLLSPPWPVAAVAVIFSSSPSYCWRRAATASRGSRESSFPCVRFSWGYEGGSGATGFSRLPGGDRCGGENWKSLLQGLFPFTVADGLRET